MVVVLTRLLASLCKSPLPLNVFDDALLPEPSCCKFWRLTPLKLSRSFCAADKSDFALLFATVGTASEAEGSSFAFVLMIN